MLSEKELLGRYSYYYDEIKRLGSFGILEKVKFDDLSLPKGKVRKAYMEIKSGNFEGTIIDYLCWVSANKLLHFMAMNKAGLATDEVEFFSHHKEDVANCIRYLSSRHDNAIRLIREWKIGREDVVIRYLYNYIRKMELNNFMGSRISIKPKVKKVQTLVDKNIYLGTRKFMLKNNIKKGVKSKNINS